MEVPLNNSTLPLLLLGSLGILLISSSVIVFFFRYQKKLQKQKEKLLLTELAFKQKLLEANIQSQEEERARISRDLHDNIGGSLSTLRFLIGQLGNAENDTDKVQSLTGKYSEMIDSVIDDVRNISHLLTPPGLAIFGLHEALEILCEKVSSTTNMTITLKCKNEKVKKIHYDHALAIYRVIQELLTNTLKHAFASRVQITINGNDQLVQLTYSDDGRGVDITKLSSKGIGMQNIENRILMTGGQYNIQTAPEKGYTFVLEIPIITKHV